MLPQRHKFTSPADFSRTVKSGARAGSKTVVVHLHIPETEPGTAPVTVGGPRFGLVVSKAVGNAVARHSTARKLRHICLKLAAELPKNAGVVIRALPASATADSEQLARDVRKAVRKAREKTSGR